MTRWLALGRELSELEVTALSRNVLPRLQQLLHMHEVNCADQAYVGCAFSSHEQIIINLHRDTLVRDGQHIDGAGRHH